MPSTGLTFLDQLPWGQHFALFYEAKRDLLDICVPFLNAGLKSRDVCAWVAGSPLTDGDAWAAFNNASPNFEQDRAACRMIVLDNRTWAVTEGRPDFQKVARSCDAMLADARERGYEGLRIAAMVPALQDDHRWAEFFEYEEQLHHYLLDKAMLVLCLYPLMPQHATDVMRTHSSMIKKRGAEWQVHEGAGRSSPVTPNREPPL